MLIVINIFQFNYNFTQIYILNVLFSSFVKFDSIYRHFYIQLFKI